MEMFALETKIENLEEVNGGLTRVKCYVAYPDKNRKKIDIPKKVFENAIPSALGMPIVAHFFSDGELGGHADDIVKHKFEMRKTGKTYAYGFVDYTQMPKWETIGDKEWLTMVGYLFTERFPESKKIIKSNQSMEVKLNIDSIQDGYKKVSAMQFMSLCSLNKRGISPTFENSQFVKFSEYDYDNEELEDYYKRMKELFKNEPFVDDDETIMATEWLIELVEEIGEIYNYECTDEDYKLLYNSFYEENQKDFAISSKYNGINFKPPVSVAKSAQSGLDMRAKQVDSNKCCTSVGLARARQLINRQNLSPNTVKRMKSYFDRHSVDKKSKDWDNESKGKQAWLIWGGDAGYRWAKKIVAQMDKKDAENMSMAEDDLNDYSIKVSTDPKKTIDGNVGKKNISKMKTKILNASNAMEIIPKIFARYPSNLEDVERIEIGYPLMSERDGVFYYNIGFIKAASARIEQFKEEPYYEAVKSKIKTARKKVGMEEDFSIGTDEKSKKEGFSMTMEDKRQALSDAVKEHYGEDWVYVRDFDESYVYVSCDGGLFRYEYEKDGMEVDMNTKTKVTTRTEYVPFSVTEQFEGLAKDMYEKYGMKYMPYAIDGEYVYAMDTENDMAKMMIPFKEEEGVMACDYEKVMAGEDKEQEMAIRTVMGMLKEKLNKMKEDELDKVTSEFTAKESDLNEKLDGFTTDLAKKEEEIISLKTEKTEFSTKIEELTSTISEKDAKIEEFSNQKTKLEFEAILGKEDFAVLTEEDKSTLMEDFSITQDVLIEKAEALSFRRSKEQGLIQTKEGNIAQFGIPQVEKKDKKTNKTAYESVKDYINKG